MKVLFLTNRVPFPATSGYPIVVYNSIKGMLEQGAEVSVFSLNPQNHFIDTRTLKDPVLEKIRFVPVTINNNISIISLFLNILKRRSSLISRFYKSESVAKLKNFLRHHQFDIVQLEGLFVMPYLNIIRQYSKAKIIYRAHNIEHQINVTPSTSGVSAIRRLYHRMLARRLYKFEIENLNRPDAVLTISKHDQSHLIHLGCKICIENFPVALDPGEYVPDSSKIEHSSIFHVGSMNFIPTIEGLEWFMRTVWPDLDNLKAGLKFHIAGREIPDSFYLYENENIIIHDDLDSAKEFINSKSIMIVPLRSGSGMRVKIIEGMALKKCVISTSLGAEGIQYEHKKNILIADTADEFYRYILQCTTDVKFAEEIGENARKLVEKEYHIEPNSKRLSDFYHTLINT